MKRPSCFGKCFAGLVLAFAVFGALLLPAPAGAQDYEFIVIKKKPQSFRVAVPEFRVLNDFPANDNARTELTGILREVVEMTGLLELVSPEAYPAAPLGGDREDLAPWALINSQFLIRGDVAALSGGRYQVEFRVFDIRQNKMEMGKRYTGERDLFNRMVMRFMDEFIGRLTNRMGSLDARVAYVTDAGGRNEIHVMDTDGSHDQSITSNRTLNLSPAWSRDGRYLLYLGYRAHNPDLYLVDLQEGRETRFYSAPGLNLSGEFSPDGRTIVFSREGADGNVDIYTLTTNGQNIQRVTSAGSIEVSPTWSPDGKFMAFLSDRTGTPQIYLLDLTRGPESANNSAVRLSTEGSYNSSPAWSPDGLYIAYTGRVGGQFDLFLIDMTGTGRQIRRLTATSANEEDPAWSSDSRFLVYASNKYGNYDIYIMSIYGGTPRRLTKSAARERMPSWSPRMEP